MGFTAPPGPTGIVQGFNLIPGAFTAPASMTYAAAANVAIVLNRLYLVPFFTRATFSALAIQVAIVSAGGFASLSLYDTDDEGNPSQQLQDCGIGSTAALGNLILPFAAPYTFDRPVFAAVMFSLACSVRGPAAISATSSAIIGGASLSGATGNVGYFTPNPWGSLPADLTGAPMSFSASGITPVVAAVK